MHLCRLAGRPAYAALVVVATLGIVLTSSGGAATITTPARDAEQVLQDALTRIAQRPGGPPGIAVVIQRGAEAELLTGGVADLDTGAPVRADDHVRLASVAKAFSGATALSVVADGALALDDTLGSRVAGLPSAWSGVTLAELLQHTSGIPDFSRSPAFQDALRASLLVPPPPITLLSYVADEPLRFEPGSKYHYSNSDNIAVGLMIEAATGHPYGQEVQERVATPLALVATSLPDGAELPVPFVHGYDVSTPAQPADVSEVFAAGWTWASGGIVSSPADANRFIRGYAAGATTDDTTRARQRRFRSGSSEPPGPGANAAGLAIFRYRTRCGTVYGHTGNTPGYTQFVAATADGSRSTSVAINAQITPTTDRRRFSDVRRIFGLAVCAALATSG